MSESGKRVLLLWDIDHTLIENGGVSKATYACAFARLTGSAPTVQPTTHGRTDREIMRNLFKANESHLTSEIEAKIDQALIECSNELTSDLLERGVVLPGVAGALQQISQYATVVQSVLTGNLQHNAKNKLMLLGDSTSVLDLEVGGYGSDHTTRSELVGIAQAKARRKYAYNFDHSSTVLVGDTARDVEAAREGGAKIIAVATGVTTVSELKAAGADAVLTDLTDLNALLEALGKLTGSTVLTAST